MHPTYFTPIKPGTQYHRQLFNSDSVHRQGDWVCVNCQNLNYSFRKKCNRCKTQSRDDNDKQSVYSYYYYNNRLDVPVVDANEFDWQEHNGEEIEHLSEKRRERSAEDEDDKENDPNEWNAVMETPKKKKYHKSPTTSKLDGLPSVSPLVKKYRLKQHHTTLQKLKQHTTPNIFELSQHGKQFESVKIRDFDQLIMDLNFTNGSKNEIENSSPFKDNSEEDDVQGHKFMKEIEESISRIII